MLAATAFLQHRSPYQRHSSYKPPHPRYRSATPPSTATHARTRPHLHLKILKLIRTSERSLTLVLHCCYCHHLLCNTQNKTPPKSSGHAKHRALVRSRTVDLSDICFKSPALPNGGLVILTSAPLCPCHTFTLHASSPAPRQPTMHSNHLPITPLSLLPRSPLKTRPPAQNALLRTRRSASLSSITPAQFSARRRYRPSLTVFATGPTGSGRGVTTCSDQLSFLYLLSPPAFTLANYIA